MNNGDAVKLTRRTVGRDSLLSAGKTGVVFAVDGGMTLVQWDDRPGLADWVPTSALKLTHDNEPYEETGFGD